MDNDINMRLESMSLEELRELSQKLKDYAEEKDARRSHLHRARNGRIERVSQIYLRRKLMTAPMPVKKMLKCAVKPYGIRDLSLKSVGSVVKAANLIDYD